MSSIKPLINLFADRQQCKPCFAYKSECLSCAEGKTEEDFCKEPAHKRVPGCGGKFYSCIAFLLHAAVKLT